jgi:hypothetical protein
MKVVINTDYGGFGLSEKALEEYKQKANITDPDFYYWDIPRTCPILIEMVERMMSDTINTPYSDLKVIEIPDDVEWQLEEYDGAEWIAEKHRTWTWKE